MYKVYIENIRNHTGLYRWMTCKCCAIINGANNMVVVLERKKLTVDDNLTVMNNVLQNMLQHVHSAGLVLNENSECVWRWLNAHLIVFSNCMFSVLFSCALLFHIFSKTCVVVQVQPWPTGRITAATVYPKPAGCGHQGFCGTEWREVYVSLHPNLLFSRLNCPQPAGIAYLH